MGYIEQTDVGNAYITDINDWFATLSNLNRECKNYIDSEIRYKEIIAEHDKQIRADVIDEYFNTFDEWIKSTPKLSYFWTEFEVMARKIAEQLKEQNNE